MNIPTPYYLIDEKKLLRNMQLIHKVQVLSGAKFVLALKCFSTWSVFPLMRKYMAGTTSSSVLEARLGAEKFGGETHAYCVGYTAAEVQEAALFADKIIFNSVSQLDAYYEVAKKTKVGLRVNPGFSYSHFDLADPARRYSRLGVVDQEELKRRLPLLSGLMFHYNCENDDFATFASQLDRIGETYGDLLQKMEWVSLGGGIYFTQAGYPLEAFCQKLADFASRFQVQVYLEPGESAITNCAELVTSVVDLLQNEVNIAIVDASVEAHMLDLLIYRLSAKMEMAEKEKIQQQDSDRAKTEESYSYLVGGRSCLAGDIFGTFTFPAPLGIGDKIHFADAAGYTMVKKNWFNGLPMPAIAVARLDGSVEVIRNFVYADFLTSLS